VYLILRSSTLKHTMINTAQRRMQSPRVPCTALTASHVLHVTLRCTQTLKSQWTRSHFPSNS